MTPEIAPGAMTTTNKRVRYETTNSNPNDLPSTPSVSANQSPNGCALSSVRTFTVTLRRHLSPIVHKAAESHVDLMHKLMTKMNQFTKMDGDNDFIPRSARLANFEFRVSKKVENSPEFLTIKGETDALVLEFRLKLKQKIMDTLKIECTMLRAELYESLITNIHLVVQAQLITDKTMENPHKIVITIIEYYYEEIFDHTDLDKDEFIEIYKNTHGLATFPLPPDATPPPDHSTQHMDTSHDEFVSHPDANARHAVLTLQTTCLPAKRLILSAFSRPIQAYFNRAEAIEVDLSLKKLHTASTLEDATNATKERLDVEESIDTELLDSVIRK